MTKTNWRQDGDDNRHTGRAVKTSEGIGARDTVHSFEACVTVPSTVWGAYLATTFA